MFYEEKVLLTLTQNDNMFQFTLFLNLCLCARHFFCVVKKAPWWRTFKSHNIFNN